MKDYLKLKDGEITSNTQCNLLHKINQLRYNLKHYSNLYEDSLKECIKENEIKLRKMINNKNKMKEGLK